MPGGNWFRDFPEGEREGSAKTARPETTGQQGIEMVACFFRGHCIQSAVETGLGCPQDEQETDCLLMRRGH
jgi:hypothetical protein